MAIFTRLLQMRMVARSVLGFSFNDTICLLDLESSLLNLAMSFGDNEKNAISLPEINADDKMSMASNTKEIRIPLVNRIKLA